MRENMKPFTYAIPCLFGLEGLVGDEVRRLGLEDVQVENGRVLCRGTGSEKIPRLEWRSRFKRNKAPRSGRVSPVITCT